MPYIGELPEKNTRNEDIAKSLNMVLQGVMLGNQENQDRAYRKSAAKLLGVPETDLGYFQREELKDLVKEKMKSTYAPKEWKPTTKEEAMALKKAEFEGKVNFEKIKNKLKFGLDEEGNTPSDEPSKPKYDPSKVKSWSEVPLMSRIMSAITPSNTPEEAALGGLRPGGILLPPKVGTVGQAIPSAIPKVAPEVAAPDPIAQRIQEALAKGIDPAEISRQLTEKGIDPSTYGL